MTTTLTEAQARLMSQRLFAWLDALQADYEAKPYTSTQTYEIDPRGRKYKRIMAVYTPTGRGEGFSQQRSVHAFYEPSTGNVYKAAGWKAPAAGVRFNLLDDASYERMMTNLDWSGRYLYIR